MGYSAAYLCSPSFRKREKERRREENEKEAKLEKAFEEISASLNTYHELMEKSRIARSQREAPVTA
jgi:DNA-binding protein H-NS